MALSWEPLHEAHAIRVAAAVINFSESLNEISWRRVVRAAEQKCIPAGLTNKATANVIQLVFGGGNLAGAPLQIPSKEADQVQSLSFQRTIVDELPSGGVRNQIIEQVVIGRTALQYQTLAYTRWKDVEAQITGLLSPSLEIAVLSVPVANIRLEYHDAFTHRGDGVPNLRELLREGSPILACHIFERSDLWHSHTGFFETPEGGPKRLVQVNVDANEVMEPDAEGPRRTVSVMTAIQDNFRSDLSTADLENPLETATSYLSRFDSLHDRSKDVFSQVVSDLMADRIGLKQ